MTEDHKEQTHPLVIRALELAYVGIDPVEFDNYAVEQLQDMLKDYFGKPDLGPAVEALLTLACFLDTKKGCHSASMKLIEVVKISTQAVEDLVNKIKTTPKD